MMLYVHNAIINYVVLCNFIFELFLCVTYLTVLKLKEISYLCDI